MARRTTGSNLSWPHITVCPNHLNFREYAIIPDDDLLDLEADFNASDRLTEVLLGYTLNTAFLSAAKPPVFNSRFPSYSSPSSPLPDFYILLSENIIPTADPITMVDSIPVEDPIPIVDPIPLVDFIPTVDPNPMVDPIPLVNLIPTVDPNSMVDPIPMVDPTPMVDPCHIHMVDHIPECYPHCVLCHCPAAGL